ncbi:FtsX-like permease family protein [Kribbella sp. NPDC050124]|uniref:FtsX-like permease family protein n=1 Tax=Kribbella sp. NPDC050124 TaxID=3364114 RepID=UPI0037B6C89E
MIRLAFSSLRYRTAAFLAIFVAVTLGSALLCAAGGLLETGLRLNAPPQRLAAAPIVVTGDPAYHPPNGSGSVAFPERQPLDASLVTKLASTAGVAQAIPDRSFPVVVAASKEPVSGHTWSSAALAPYQLIAGRPPAAGEVVVDQRLGARPGDQISVVVNGTAQAVAVAGVATAQAVSVAGVATAPAVFFADGDVSSEIYAIGVFPAAGVTAQTLRLELPEGVEAYVGDDRGVAEYSGIATSLPLIIMSGVFGGMVAVVMALVVSATIGLSVRQRRRELALLRASGATPRQVHRMVVTETMVVGLIGLLVGLASGRVVGDWIFGLLTDGGIVPSQLRFDQGPLPFAGAALLTFVVLRVTVGIAAGRAARIRPIQALAEAAVPSGELGKARLVVGLVFAAATAGIAVSTMFMSPANAAAIGGPAGLTGSIAVAILGPRVIRTALVPRVTAFLEGRGPSGFLAVTNLRVRAAQFTAILVPITLASAIALGNIYSQTTQEQAAVEAYTDNLAADVVVTNPAGVPTGLAEELRSLPGVTAASELVRSKGWIEEPYDASHTSDPWPLLGLSGPVYEGKVKAGSLDDLTGSTIALPPDTARKLKVGVGSEIGVRLGDNALVKVKVAALVEGPDGYEPLLLPSALLAVHTTSGQPEQVLLTTDSPVAPDLSKWPGATIGGRELLAAEYDAGLGIDAWIGYLLAGIAIAYTAIASVNTIAVAVLDRRREFGLQRLTGSTSRQVKSMLYLEHLVIAALGLVLGVVTAACAVLPIAVATRGWPIPAGTPLVLLGWIAVVFLLVLPATAITARIALRAKPMDALSSPVG